ncbi:S1C family serine protease [Aquirhabdus parva]|uniref:S1C family serine protease n=1 Tax=Aquirhabdus parva TaxID=2283318 RepID=UPI0026B60C05
MRRVMMLLPWFLLVAVVAYFWQLQEGWKKHTETVTVQNQPPLVVQGSGAAFSYSAAVKVAAPAVVNIYTTQKVRVHPLLQDPMLRRFFEFHQGRADQDNPSDGSSNKSPEPTSLGSGVIVTADGYILTNNHVVAKADKIVVALHDGRRAQAKVVGTDPDSDLAVIKVDLTGLPVLPFRKSSTEVGDIVLAIGNPFGVGQTVTHGIISATGRSGLGINAYEDFIQTDAAINPGNSGGALVDVSGSLVGINTAIFSRSGGSMGIGFAIPANLAQQVLTDIIQNGKVTRGWLGIEVRNQVDPADDLVASSGTSTGVKIVGTQKNGPADRGGLKANDTILDLNGTPITSAGQLIQLVALQKPNTQIQLNVKRGDQTLKLAINVAERPPATAKSDDDQNNDDDAGQLPFGLFGGQ